MQLKYQAVKKCISMIHSSKTELVSQIARVESLRIDMDAAQVTLIEKIMWETTAMGDLIFKDDKGGNGEGGREWDNFG